MLALARPVLREVNSLEELVYWSVITKLKHVGDDPNEKSIRLLLNYGHTFGQAIETYYGLNQDSLRHGEAIALGISVAARLSLLIDNNLQTNILWEQTNLILKEYYLPNKLTELTTIDLPTVSTLIDNLINDKKRIAKGNRFILCDRIGSAKVKLVVENKLIKDSFNALF